ncbi:membrane protein [Salmonella enterica subsp. enterica]|uniref:Membrane protein n=1 Tax=Salmonella enterica I TaxID=59201 RepID=A0A379VM67_SALET|nr:membrane protein [Salmonella enterica subsp. enterica]
MPGVLLWFFKGVIALLLAFAVGLTVYYYLEIRPIAQTALQSASFLVVRIAADAFFAPRYGQNTSQILYCQIALYPSRRGWAFQDRDLGVLVGQPVPRRRAVCHDAGASVLWPGFAG